jgi:glycosyltransferase involved in cell wall biosynthesis
MDNVKPKLYLNMILKESEPVEMVKRSIDSVKDHVDGMYITVTYGDVKPETSALIDLLHQYGAEVSYFKWVDDFSKARQYALDQIPQDPHTYVYWQDADDILKGADRLRECMEVADKLNWAGVFFVYWYRVALDEKGNPREILIEQQRERIIRNDGTYKWVGMLHETLIGQKTENFQQHLQRECYVVHLSTDDRISEALHRNIRILEAQLKKEKHRDPRTLVYLGKSYFDIGVIAYKDYIDKHQKESEDNTEEKKEAVRIRDEWFKRSQELLLEYLTGKGEMGDKDYIEQSGWKEERATGWQYLAQIYVFWSQLDDAMYAINQAIEEAPFFPTYYIEKAAIYTQMKDYKTAKHWLIIATNLEVPQTTLMMSPRDMKVRALECDAHIAMHLDHDMKRVSEDYQKLLEIEPDNETYKQNMMVADSLEAANKAMQSVVYLGKYLERIGEPEKVLPLLSAVPNDFRREAFYAQMRHKYIPPRMWEDNEIAILCGPGFEAWSPKNVEKGIGGSEEAVIYLSQQLQKLGWKVTVYASPEADEGEYDGVVYENYYKFNPEDLFNHLILWRGLGVVDIKPKARGKVILWMHDMPNVGDFTKERLERIDKIAVLSQYHREQIKQFNPEPDGEPLPLPDDKFLLTRNGIPDLGITSWKGNPHRMCYVSSPDRGLIYLLKMWKDIRAAVPDAELEIYYGFDMYDFIHRGNPAKMAFKRKIMELMKQDGISYKGRVGHKELAEAMNQCGIWAYPTDFTEISCISAMKAQAVGAVPVVTDFAALHETVRNGLKVDVDIQDKAGQKIYADALIDILLHPKQQEEYRDLKFAQTYFSWENVAKQWDGYLSNKDANQQIMMTPKQWQEYLTSKKEGKQL